MTLTLVVVVVVVESSVVVVVVVAGATIIEKLLCFASDECVGIWMMTMMFQMGSDWEIP